MNKLDFEYLEKHLKYDSSTGLLTWKILTKGRLKNNNNVGTINSRGYLQVNLKGKSILYHRICYTLYYKQSPIKPLDHINGNRLDNRIYNLREATHRQNNTNMPTHRLGRLVGAQYRKDTKKWRAVCKVNKKRANIGQFDTELEAHQAYLKYISDNNIDN